MSKKTDSRKEIPIAGLWWPRLEATLDEPLRGDGESLLTGLGLGNAWSKVHC